MGIISHCFLHYTGKTGAPREAGLKITTGKLKIAYEAAKCLEKGRKWATLSYWPPVLASLLHHVHSIVLWPGWCAGCPHGAVSKHLWSRNKILNFKMFVSGDRHTHSWHGSSLQGFWAARVPHSCINVLHGLRQSPNFFFPSDCSPSLRGAVLPPPAKCGCFYGRASGDPLNSIAVLYGFAGK